jgi:Rrf2 family protein
MFFSKPTEYAIRAMVYLSIHASEEKKLGIKQIAANLEFPEHYLGKVLQDLAKKQIIKSAKGPHGGFYIDEKGMDISLLSLIDAIEGLQFFNTCGLGLHECNEERPCPIHKDYQIIKGNYYKLLAQKSIRKMRNDLENEIAFMDFASHPEKNSRRLKE